MLSVLPGEKVTLPPDAQFEEETSGRYRERGTNALFLPVDDMLDINVGGKDYRRQVLFRE